MSPTARAAERSAAEERAEAVADRQSPLSVQQGDVAIRVRNLSKCYHIYERPEDRLKQSIVPRLQRLLGRLPKNYYREFWALKDVSFQVKKGETVGIIGRNGSGKSTLLQIICGTLAPTSGTVETNGRIAALLELGSGFNPEFTGRENVYMNGAVLGLSKEEIDARFDDIAAFADIGQFIEQPVKAYSSGMVVRLAFAVAISVEAHVLVVDEALAVGDPAFQRKCVRKIQELTSAGVALLFVSHDIETVKKICSSAIYLHNGSVRMLGVAKDVCLGYEQDLFGASTKGRPIVAAGSTPYPSGLEFLDWSLLATSEKTYGDGRASIDDISITTADGQPVNVIAPGSRFVVSYKARFSGRVDRPVFGIMITNREGMCIFGTNTNGLPISSCTFESGDEVNVSFTMTNNLGPGIYYLTCGVHTSDETQGVIYNQRRIDVRILRSLGRDGEIVAGTSNLFAAVKTESKSMHRVGKATDGRE